MYKNLCEGLIKNAKFNSNSITIIDNDKYEINLSYRELYDAALEQLYVLQERGIKKNDELVFQIQNLQEFLTAFWACLLGGIVPVPIALGNTEEHKSKLIKIWKILNNPYMITSQKNMNDFNKYMNDEDISIEIKNKLILVEDLIKKSKSENKGIEASIDRSDIAFIQFSSGSTGDPKGVILTHENLLTNVDGIITGLDMNEKDTMLNWMPLTHDMGMIGTHIAPLTAGINQVIMATDMFITNPMFWMSKVNSHKATIITSPNFGLKLFLDNYKEEIANQWDLSSVKAIVNGAEPISSNVCDDFLNIMSKYGLKKQCMFAAYGMAEATVAVSFPPLDEMLKVVHLDRYYLNNGDTVKEVCKGDENCTSFIDLGYPVKGCKIRVCDDDGKCCEEKVIGNINVAGKNVTRGYYNNEKATKDILTSDGWLRTGDLGFIINGRLVVTGRSKEVIVINGQNYYPYDIEEVIEKIESVGQAVACGVQKNNKEELVIFVLSKNAIADFAKVAIEIKKQISISLGLNTNAVIPIKEIPKTSSGKIKRYKLARRYIAGEFDEQAEAIKKSVEEIFLNKNSNMISDVEESILNICNQVLADANISINNNFFELGINSLQLNLFMKKLNKLYPGKVETTDLFAYPSIKELSEYIIKNNKDQDRKEEISKDSNDIAIIGIGLKFPMATTADEYWNNIANKVDSIREFPSNRRKDADAYLKFMGLSKKNIKYLKGGYLDEIDKFDYRLFRITPKEANLMNSNQKLFLETAWKAIEDAGYSVKAMSGSKTGVYVGYIGDTEGYKYKEMVHNVYKSQDSIATAGNLPSIIPSRISYFMNLKGPSILVDTACSSSLVAVHLACKGLLNGDCDTALAGGIRISLLPIEGKEKLGMESVDGKAKTFDDSSDGTGFGEGVGVVVLKPLKRAIKDRDNIYAVIKGSAINQDGKSIGITAPNLLSQVDVIESACKNAKVNPETISYIEAHGTGTKLGDRVEIEGISNAFKKYTDKKQFCGIGSVKTNIGHLFEAAGIAGLIKATLALNHKLLPPTINFAKPNKTINFEDSPIYVNDVLRKWEAGEYPRRCGISAFGFSGTNCHVILEEYDRNIDNEQEEANYIFTLSARSENGLKKLIQNYRLFLEKDCNIQDLCYTASNGRMHFNYRFATIVSSKEELKEILNEIIDSEYNFAINDKLFYDKYEIVTKNKKALAKNEIYFSKVNQYTEECNNFINEICSFNYFKDEDLKKICYYYIKGADIQWELLYKNANKITLPFTSFERERCWIDIPDQAIIDDNNMYYKLAFKKKSLEQSVEVLGQGDILIFKDYGDISKKLIDKFKRSGRNVIQVQIGERFDKISSEEYMVGDKEEDYTKLFQFVNIKNITDIIHLSSLGKLEVNSVIQLKKSQQNGVYSLFNLYKALVKSNLENIISVVFIVDYANSISEKEITIKPQNASLITLGKVLIKESEKIQIRCIDIDENTAFDDIYNSIMYQKEYRASYRDNVRYVEELVSIDIENKSDAAVNIIKDGVYVISGGMGGIGSEIAKYIAEKNKVVIAMINRSTLPERTVWDKILTSGEDKKTCMKINLIKQIEASGSVVECISADISNYDETKLAIDGLREKYGKINGVIHGAGVAGRGYIENKKEETFRSVLAAKVYGTWILNEVTKNDNIDFFVTLSSVAAILTVQGQGDYAAANAYMDSFAEYRRQQGKMGLSINWTQWKEIGMALENGVNTDTIFKAIPTNSALMALDKVMNKNLSRVLIGQLNFESKMVKLISKFPFEVSKEINECIERFERNRKVQEASSETEKEISKICMEVLGLKEVDVDQSFFDLGADSIMLNSFSEKLEKKFKRQISVAKIFGNPTIAKLGQYIDSDNKNIPLTKDTGMVDNNLDIAVIGLSTVMPGAKNVKEFWNNLRSGRDSIGEFPVERRLDADRYLEYLNYDVNNANYLQGGYLREIDKFDCKFFKITPKEASLMDPNQKLFLEAAWSAIEDAGYGGKKIIGSNTGVYVGFANNSETSYRQMVSEVEHESMRIAIAGNLPAIIPSRVSYIWDLKGPSIVVDTACSSSLVAIHLACNALKKGECGMAIVGGVKINLLPLDNQVKIGIESSDYRTRAFDNSSDGTVMGEGVGAVILKPLQKAIEDKDNIYAVIKGSAINQDGNSTGITAPNASAQTKVLLSAWKDSGIDPETISYIEAHGTGTKIGDPIEVEGLTDAFRKYTNKTQFCAIGSVKTNIGHLLEASGIASFIKVVLSLKNKELVPSIHFKEPNSRINFKESPVYVNTLLKSWMPKYNIRRCGVSAFGLSGTNCHVVLEEFQSKTEQFNGNENNCIFTLSAKSRISLINLAKEYIDVLNEDMNINNVCYTVNTGRGHYNHRISFVVSSISEIKGKLQKFIKCDYDSQGNMVKFYGQHKVTSRDIKNEKNIITRDEIINLSDQANSKLDEYIATGKNDIKLINDVCNMYIKGANVLWENLYNNTNVTKVSLPTYSFEKERSWIDVPIVHGENGYGMYYSINYVEDKINIEDQMFNFGNALVIRNDSVKCSKITSRIGEKCNILEVYIGKEFYQISNNKFVVSGNKEDYIKILQQYKVNEIINCITLDNKEINSEEQLKLNINQGIDSLIGLFNAFETIEIDNRIGFTLITEYSDKVNNDSIIKPENASLVGLCRGRVKEFKNLNIRCIDIDSSTSIDTVYKLLMYRKEFLTFCREEKIYSQEFNFINLEKVNDVEIEIRENGTYVITGGTGGMGSEIAKFLASKNKVKLVLINRTKIPEKRYWAEILQKKNDSKICKIIENVKVIEAKGSEVIFMSANVSDLEYMKNCFDRIRRDYGNINGIIHAAGISGYSDTWEKSKEKVLDIMNPKIFGTWVLDKITEKDSIDFFILCSSISTVFCGPRQSEYVAANCYMDSYAAYRNHCGKRTIAIDWPIWKEVGMSLDSGMNVDTLFKAISTQTAITAFDKLLNKNISRVVVGKINENKNIEAWNKEKTIKVSHKLNETIINMNKGWKKNKNDKSLGNVVLKDENSDKYIEIEQKLTNACMEVMGVKELDINEKFFDLGADSILLSVIAEKLEKMYPQKVSIAKLFSYPSIKELAHYIFEEEDKLTDKESKDNVGNDIAVIGISCKLPSANDTDELWRCLIEGKNCITTLPQNRKKDVDNYFKFLGEDVDKIKYVDGAFIDEIDKFDYKFFKITPKEAGLMDPNQRLFLETAWKAIEDAGYGGKGIIGSRTGVYVGYSGNFKDCYGRLVSEVDPQLMSMAVPGNLPSIIPSRISYLLNLKGPSLLIDTACSSSLVAIHLACLSLRKKECDMAIAGGIKINLLPISGQINLGIESSDGMTKSFDDSSDGTGIGEGIAAVILKPLNRAIEDKDNIYAVIKGTAINQDGSSMGITAPNAKAQTEVIQSAWEDAGINPETISYIEAHGTGTKLGDPIEIEALTKAFRKYTNRNQFCAIGSIKTNMGHLFEASGIVGFIKAVLSLKNKEIPAMLHFEHPNSRINFENSPVYVNTKLKEWSSDKLPRRCGVSSFGFSGTNCHVVLEEANIYNSKIKNGNKLNILTLSAKSEKALIRLIKKYSVFLKKEVNMDEVCYTANTGRQHYNYRLALICRSKEEFKNKINRLCDLSTISESELNKQDLNEDILYGYTGKTRDIADKQYSDAINKVNNLIQNYLLTGRQNVNNLIEIGSYYTKGTEIDWQKLYLNDEIKKISLPTYQFEKTRCWIDKLDDEKGKDNYDNLFYVLGFKKRLLNKNNRVIKNSTILVFKDREGKSDELIKYLKDDNNKIIEVVQENKFIVIDSDHYCVGNNEEDYIKLIDQVKDKNINYIIHMSTIKQNGIEKLEQLEQHQGKSVYSLFYLNKVIAKNNIKNQIRILLVSEYVNSVTGKEEIIKPENAGLFALGKAVVKENPNIQIKCVDIDSETSIKDVYEAFNFQEEYRTSYRNGIRYIEEFKVLDVEEKDDANVEIKKNGVYIITGGMGGIGFEVCKYLAKCNKVTLALINRTELPERSKWDNILSDAIDTRLCEKIRLIREIELSGSRVICIGADVADYKQIELAIGRIRQKYGSINGVIHAAGVAGDGYLVRKDESIFTNVLKPKVYGTWILDKVTENDKLDFFIMFSSIATILTVQGQGDYAAANSYMDSFAEYRNMKNKKTSAINWVSWKEVGMAANYGVNTDTVFKAIYTDKAIRAFDKVINKNINRVLIGELNFDSSMIFMLEKFQFELSADLKERIRKLKKVLEMEEKTTETQRIISKVCKEILGVDNFDINESFLDIGADSIALNELSGRLGKSFHKKISVAKIFTYPTIEKLANYIDGLEDTNKNTKVSNSKKNEGSRDIAIIGMATKMPNANNVSEYWENLKNNIDCIKTLPVQRKEDTDEYLAYTGMDIDNIKYLEEGYIEDIDKFDYKFFGITHKDASLMDPNQRLFLETAVTAIEDSGYGGKKIVGSNTGVYVGCGNNFKSNYGSMIDAVEPRSLSMAIPGNIPAVIPSRVSYIFDLKGPSIMLDTACSSSLLAVHLACNALRKGECDMALAGGIKLDLLPISGYVKLGIESSDNKTRAFDNLADGTGKGEGVGVVVLKELDRAINDGDNIYAVIKGSAVNQDGKSASLTSPNAMSQKEVIVSAWNDSNVDPETISYIEAHGTGTKLGDPIEIEGLTEAFRSFTDKKQFCAIGSVKSNIGHLYEASGIAGLIKLVMSLKNKQLLALKHFQKPNDNIDFESSPVYVSDKNSTWESQNNMPRRCGISAFGLSGTNCHIVLEEKPYYKKIINGNEQINILTLSAKSNDSLNVLVNKYINYVDHMGDMGDVCYTANTGRGHYDYRVAIVINDKVDLLNKLINIKDKNINQIREKGVYAQVNHIVKDIDSIRNVGDVTKEDISNISKTANKKILEVRGSKNLELIEEICELYVKGANIDWEKLYNDKEHRKISLPTYPFERQRCWLKVPKNKQNEKDILNNVDRMIKEAFIPTELSSELKLASERLKELLEKCKGYAAGNSEKYAENKVILKGRDTGAYTITEMKIADIWSDVLGLTEIDINDNYFEIGGDSIKAIQIASRFQESENIKVKLDINDILQYQTIEDLAIYIDNAIQLEEEMNEYTETTTVTPIQKFIFERMNNEEELYQFAILTHKNLKLNEALVQKVFDELSKNNDVLNSEFRCEGGEVYQYTKDASDKFEVEVIDLTASNEYMNEIDKEIKSLQLPIETFNVNNIKVKLFKTNKKDYLFIIVSPLISDNSSISIIINEFIKGYLDFDSDQSNYFSDNTDIFKTWCNAITSIIKTESYDEEIEYWNSIDDLGIQRLPVDKENETSLFDNMSDEISKEDTALLLNDANKAYNTEIKDIALTALADTLEQCFDRNKFIVDVWETGRNNTVTGIDVKNAIGIFSYLYPIAIDVSGTSDIAHRIKIVKEYVRHTPNDGIGFGLLKSDENLFNICPDISLRCDLDETNTSIGEFEVKEYLSDDTARTIPYHNIEMNLYIKESKLQMEIKFNNGKYNDKTILNFAKNYKYNLLKLINHCIGKDDTELTPSDFDNEDLSIQEVEDIFKLYD